MELPDEVVLGISTGTKLRRQKAKVKAPVDADAVCP